MTAPNKKRTRQFPFAVSVSRIFLNYDISVSVSVFFCHFRFLQVHRWNLNDFLG